MAGCSHNDSRGRTKLDKELHILSKFPKDKWTTNVNWRLTGDVNGNDPIFKCFMPLVIK